MGTMLKWLAIGVIVLVTVKFLEEKYTMTFHPEVYSARQAAEAADAAREKAKVAAAEATKEADARAKRENGFHCLSGWDGSHRQLVSYVKDRLREPSSFEHIETRVTPVKDGTHTALMRYRARNGFGGMNVGTVVSTYAHDGCQLIKVAM